MATGTVRYFDDKRGSGFIRDDDTNRDIFVTIETAREAGMTGLKKDQRLSYDIHEDTENSKSAAAKNLKFIVEET